MALDQNQEGTVLSLSLENVEVTDNELGRGSYGVVLEVKVNKMYCAGKKIHDAIVEKFTLEKFNKEIILHSQQHHRNIVKLFGVHFIGGKLRLPMLVMEYLPVSLTKCITKIPDKLKYSVLFDVATGLSYLHQKQPPVIHRDLTANNILLTANFTAKISDLGVSRLIDKFKDKTFSTAPGTPIVMPPEALEHNPVYNHKLDVFSYGCLIIHVFSGQFPKPTSQFLPKLDDPGLFVMVTEWDRRSSYVKQMSSDNKLLPIAKKCLSNDPTNRPEITTICEVIKYLLTEYKGSIKHYLIDKCIHNMLIPCIVVDAPRIQFNGIDAPNIRACPNCGEVVEHTTIGNKFVHCPRCKVHYCFVCLEFKEVCVNSSIDCFSGKCANIAPKQTVIQL